MTDTTTENELVRRHGHDSIDFDFYRTRATALRGQARREGRSLRSATAGVLVMAGAIGFALVINSPALGERVATVLPSQTQIR